MYATRTLPRSVLLTVGLVAFAVVAVSAGADDWSRFRGLSAGAAPDDPALPDTWSPTDRV